LPFVQSTSSNKRATGPTRRGHGFALLHAAVMMMYEIAAWSCATCGVVLTTANAGTLCSRTGCLDCLARVAVEVLGPGHSRRSEHEIQGAIELLARWLEARR